MSKKENINIQHAENEAEFKIPNTRYSADGYCKETNTIYEFHGCYWHGCKKCFEDRDEINKVTKKKMEQLYIKTQKKKKWCIEYGYNYKEIWECEWYDLEDEVELIFED
jgi:G:T-mismatch repair DNA endonuclease (very short patch repair protein)